jgi:hypothetical protein
MFLSSLVVQGRVSVQTTDVLLRGIQDFGLSFIEAATKESKGLIAESIAETKRASENSQRMTREAIDSVFKSVYQRNVPEELVEHYETNAFRQNFFRRDDEYTYTLTLPENARPDDPMSVDVYHKFRMVNLAKQDLDYELRQETSLPLGEAVNPPSSYFDLRVDNVPFPEGKVEAVQYPGSKSLVLTQRIRIPKGASRQIEVSWTMVRRVRDTEVLLTSWPSNGMTVHVNYDRAFRVTADALHPSQLSDVKTGARSSKWSLVGGMIMGQGMCISWEPKT